MESEPASKSESAAKESVPDESFKRLVGHVFAYRARAIDDLVPVQVLKAGTKKPPRVLIRFEDPAMEGHEEWVPPARLKIAWDHVDTFRADEARWNAVHALAPRSSAPEAEAAEQAAALLIPDDVAVLSRGCLRVHDVRALAELTGTDEDFIASHPQGFSTEAGALIVPWPLALDIVKKALTRNPDPVLASVMREEATARYEAIHGHHYSSTRGHQGFISPEKCAKYDAESSYGAPMRALLRKWAGDGTERWDELIELRKEIKRVGEVAETAIRTLRERGHVRDADRLETQLGMTVEMLRPSVD